MILMPPNWSSGRFQRAATQPRDRISYPSDDFLYIGIDDGKIIRLVPAD